MSVPSALAGMANVQWLWRLFTLVVLAWLPALVDRGAVRAAAALYPWAESAHPYFVPGHAGLLYFWTPVVVASACILFLSPGLFLALALDAAKGVGQWVVYGLALSVLVISGATGVVQWFTGASLRDGTFAAVVVGCALLCFGLVALRLAQGRSLTWPLRVPHARATILSMVAAPLLLLVALTPKFYWENFNGDGTQAFEPARLLLVQPLPFWHPSAGRIHEPAVTSMLFTFPAAWFIRFFGEVEASVRLPLLLYLAALFGAILALAEQGRRIALGWAEQWLIWSGLAVYVVVMAFSATYDPYRADLALPATQDTLLMVCVLGFILAFLRGESKWMVLFVGLTFISLPSGAMLIGLWLLAVMLLWRPRPWSRIGLTLAVLLACGVLTSIAPALLRALGLPEPGGVYASGKLLGRFYFLQWADWRRIAFFVVPSGILPAIALLAWRWHDLVGRTLTVVTLAYFALFYLQGRTVLHYYVPVMLLPLIVFWRNGLVADRRLRPLTLAATAAASIVALLISLPENAAPHTSARLVGAAIEDRIGGYEAVDPQAFGRSWLLRYIVPYDWDERVPLESYGGYPFIFYHYAHRADNGPRDINYLLQPAADPPPNGMRLLAREGNVALYVRSESVLASHRAMRPPTNTSSRLYSIRREILFGQFPLAEGQGIVDVRAVLARTVRERCPRCLEWWKSYRAQAR